MEKEEVWNLDINSSNIQWILITTKIRNVTKENLENLKVNMYFQKRANGGARKLKKKQPLDEYALKIAKIYKIKQNFDRYV